MCNFIEYRPRPDALGMLEVSDILIIHSTTAQIT